MNKMLPGATAAAIGNFDGVHRGHQLLLEYLISESRERGLSPLAITFDRHPLAIISPNRAPKLLQTPEEKISMLCSRGVDVVKMLFTEELRALSASEFLRRLNRDYGVKLLVVGHDNRFGSDSPQNALHSELMKKYIEEGKKIGIDVIDAPQLAGISSSAVRKALIKGDVEEAAQMLGRPYKWSGIVVHGNEIGRTIGYPTANLEHDVEGTLLPGVGVYACSAKVREKKYAAMVNIGTRPTVNDSNSIVSVEAHIIDFEGDIYGCKVELDFLRRLRTEEQFSSLEELKIQLERDRKAARKIYLEK